MNNESFIEPTMTIQRKLYGVDCGATFSCDRKYRYCLWRVWDETKPFVMFIGLNPSTANEFENDPTINSVCRLAKGNGYGGVYMMNCFAFVSTDPKLLMRNPMSDERNNDMLTVIACKCQDVVFAWGNFDVVKATGRDIELCEMFPRALMIGVNKNGSPRHPLFISGETKLTLYVATKRIT